MFDRLAFDFTDDGVSVSPINFYQLTESYQNHPEAKSLGPDGKPCEFDTRGLLQRAHIVAGEHVYIGKESDRHWEQGEDISLLESKGDWRNLVKKSLSKKKPAEGWPK